MDDDDFFVVPEPPCVYSAVLAGKSRDEVRVVIEHEAQGSEERRDEAVNQQGRCSRSPLDVAHDLKRFDLAALLVESGAVMNVYGQAPSPLVACVAYGSVENVRALLKRGHHADEEVRNQYPELEEGEWCTLLHLGVCSSMLHLQIADPVPSPDVLEVLRASSPSTRLAARSQDGRNALDCAINVLASRPDCVQAPQLQLLRDLMGAGLKATSPQDAQAMLGVMASRVLPQVVSIDEEMAARRSPSRRWRAHDDLVQLAFDARDVREAEERVRAKEARVAELEAELVALGESVEEEEEEAMEEGAAMEAALEEDGEEDGEKVEEKEEEATTSERGQSEEQNGGGAADE